MSHSWFSPSLLKLRALLRQQSTEVDVLLADNEAAMTALANTATALANVRVQSGHAQGDASTAMADLEALAARAARYAAHY